MPITLNAPAKNIEVEIALPFSKSECNRALIIQALAHHQSGNSPQVHNISQARDSQTMQRLLQMPEAKVWDVLDAGTTMRFLTAFAAITEQEKLITGTARMCQRPIGILVDALRTLGFEIEYTQAEGFPPLKIIKNPQFEQKTARIQIRGDVSSQYISALLMIAPILPKGLQLELLGKVSSRPYITMTLNQMRHFGIEHSWKDNLIEIAPQSYQGNSFTVEADWSAASYWYSIVALAAHAKITLLGLRPDSQQGDSHIQVLMRKLGVATKFLQKGVELSKIPHFIPEPLRIDFSACPDLAQTIFVIAATLKVPLTAVGLESLRIKETDRIQALKNELDKFGVELHEGENAWYLQFDEWANAENPQPKQSIKIKTYEDHRMAMAFAPLSLRRTLIIEQESVVNKSYPNFWKDLKKAGFLIDDSLS